MFRFVPDKTPIKGGEVSFRIPSGWTAPTKTADVDGKVADGKVTVAGVINEVAGDTAIEDKHLSVSSSSREVTVSIEELSRSTTGTPTSVTVTYTNGTVQRNAAEEVIITGSYKSGATLPDRTSDVVEVEIEQVDAGSGEATISRTSVDAGSEGNDLVVRFKAQGSMDGGQVRLERAPNWGDFQGTNASGKNYVKITVSSGGSLRDTAIGDDRATAFLDEFGFGDTLTFSISNTVAQSTLGIAEFTLRSAGERGDDTVLVLGIERPEDAKIIDLVGSVYQTGLS